MSLLRSWQGAILVTPSRREIELMTQFILCFQGEKFRKRNTFCIGSFLWNKFQYTEVAQLVEHWSPKPGVGSSSLSFRADVFKC